jgi:hypothetical protein
MARFGDFPVLECLLWCQPCGGFAALYRFSEGLRALESQVTRGEGTCVLNFAPPMGSVEWLDYWRNHHPCPQGPEGKRA